MDKMGGKKYVIYLAQSHMNFRRAELESIADLEGIEVDLSLHREDSPYVVVELQDDEQARKLVQRSILARGIYELWGYGNSLEELHRDVKANSAQYWQRYQDPSISFKFDFIGYHGSRQTQQEQIQIIEEFEYLDFQGPIRLKKADEVFVFLEDYEVVDDVPKREPRSIWLGRQVQLGPRIYENVVDKYDLRKRPYIGTTSFDAELSLISCNIGQVEAGKIMYDPFNGTGSFLVAGAYFGALTFGSDIDVRMLKGKGKATIPLNFKKYGNKRLFGDVLTMDFTNNAFRNDFLIDSIVCDPPYGVREGLKVCGAKNQQKSEGRENVVIDGEKAFLRRDYIQPKRPYELDLLLDDLLAFAAERLPVNGRLCFWMPTANDDFKATNIPQHRQLELKYNLVQEFNKWSRRLLCYVKRDESYQGVTVTKTERGDVNNFRQRYFTGFN